MQTKKFRMILKPQIVLSNLVSPVNKEQTFLIRGDQKIILKRSNYSNSIQ